MIPELAGLRARARCYEYDALKAGDRTAVRGFMAEQRNGIALALRYSGAAEPEEPSAEVEARVNAELEAFIDHLQLHLEPLVFAEVMRLTAQRAVGEPQPIPGH